MSNFPREKPEVCGLHLSDVHFSTPRGLGPLWKTRAHVDGDRSDMSLSELLDAATKLRDTLPGALEELGASASKALGNGSTGLTPKFWIRLDAQGFPLSVTLDKQAGVLPEGARDVFYRPA